MPASDITSMTDAIASEVASERQGGPLSESDPEIWEHMFADDIVEGVKEYKSTGTPQETAEFLKLYAQVKTVVDEALIPSGLSEAFSVFKYQVPDILVGIAKKDKTAGAEIAADLKACYLKHEDEEIAGIAKKVLGRIEKAIAPKTEKTAAFTSAAAVETPGGYQPLAGKTVVFTGTLPGMTRAEAGKLAAGMGATVTNSISKKTHILVAGDDTGSKLQKAHDLNIKVLNERQWAELVAGRGLPAEPTGIALMQTISFKK